MVESTNVGESVEEMGRNLAVCFSQNYRQKTHRELTKNGTQNVGNSLVLEKNGLRLRGVAGVYSTIKIVR